MRHGSGWLACAIAGVIAGCTSAPSQSIGPAASSASSASVFSPRSSPSTGASFFDADALAATQEDGRAFETFLSSSTMEAGMYLPGATDDDGQGAHGRDEVYVVLAGEGTLELPDLALSVPAQPGTIAFVAAGTAHHFTSTTRDLRVVVVFLARRSPGEALLASQPSDYELPAPDGITWRPVIQQGGLTVGAYLLPADGTGDAPQVHRTDELNVMLDGSGAFEVGDRPATPIDRGSIFHVDLGVPHAFGAPDAGIVDIIIFPPG